jgi:hypothetical protein
MDELERIRTRLRDDYPELATRRELEDALRADLEALLRVLEQHTDEVARLRAQVKRMNAIMGVP